MLLTAYVICLPSLNLQEELHFRLADNYDRPRACAVESVGPFGYGPSRPVSGIAVYITHIADHQTFLGTAALDKPGQHAKPTAYRCAENRPAESGSHPCRARHISPPTPLVMNDNDGRLAPPDYLRYSSQQLRQLPELLGPQRLQSRQIDVGTTADRGSEDLLN